MTHVEWDPECKCATPSLLSPFCNLWTMSNNYSYPSPVFSL
jgi:hypothetical protein